MEKKDIEKIAALARIGVRGEEIDILKEDMGVILNYISQIQEVSRSREDSSLGGSGTLWNVMREDGTPHESGMYSKDLLTAVPCQEGDYVRVKKIL